jgi:hypothetical protein
MTATNASQKCEQIRQDLAKRIRTFDRPQKTVEGLAERAKLVAELRSSVQQECLEFFQRLKDEGIIEKLNEYDYNDSAIIRCKTLQGTHVEVQFFENPFKGWMIHLFIGSVWTFPDELKYSGQDFQKMINIARYVITHTQRK